MCWCTPSIRTPFCGKPGCHAPAAKTPAQPALDVHQILREAEAQKLARAEQLPTIYDCLRLSQQLYYRLQDMGWADIAYAPKDGTYFKAMQLGCAKVMDVCYLGEWPKGSWFAAEANDLWPVRPSMFLRERPEPISKDHP